MDLVVSPAELVARLVLAVLFGGLIGWEREAHNKPAGLRTHMMVSLGAASFTLASLTLMSAGGGTGDPSRIVQGVTAGIGFLGAGSIIQSGRSVAGVTTAAGIWVVGAIGIAAGGGHYLLAGTTSVLAFLILSALRFLERKSTAERRP